MPVKSADRNLLFGILAVQVRFVSRDALMEAMNAWLLDRSKAKHLSIRRTFPASSYNIRRATRRTSAMMVPESQRT